MLIVLFVTNISIAETRTSKPTCKDVIEACDKVLEAKNKEITKKDEVIKELDLGLKDSNERLLNAVEDKKKAEKERDVWYRNPLIMIPLGIIGGFIIGPRLVR